MICTNKDSLQFLARFYHVIMSVRRSKSILKRFTFSWRSVARAGDTRMCWHTISISRISRVFLHLWLCVIVEWRDNDKSFCWPGPVFPHYPQHFPEFRLVNKLLHENISSRNTFKHSFTLYIKLFSLAFSAFLSGLTFQYWLEVFVVNSFSRLGP